MQTPLYAAQQVEQCEHLRIASSGVSSCARASERRGQPENMPNIRLTVVLDMTEDVKDEGGGADVAGTGLPNYRLDVRSRVKCRNDPTRVVNEAGSSTTDVLAVSF